MLSLVMTIRKTTSAMTIRMGNSTSRPNFRSASQTKVGNATVNNTSV